MVFKLPFQNAQKKVDNFADISFPRFQQLSSPSLHYPGFPVQTNCRHPPFNHSFAKKCRSSWCLWMEGKNMECKKCLCTIQTKEINISISFAMSFPLQGSPVWRKRLKWSQQVTLKSPQLSLSPFLPPSHRGACRGSVENRQNDYLIFTPRLRDVVGISRREL